MSDTNLPTIPLSVSIAIPLLLSLPCTFILYSLFNKRNYTWSFETDNTTISAPISENVEIPTGAPQVRYTTKQAEGRKKASLATLDIMSFLGRLQQTQKELTTPEAYAISPPQISNPSATLANLLIPALPSYTLSILLSLVSGAIYLSAVSTAEYSTAINFPLGISVTCAPFVCVAYATQAYRPSSTTSSSESPSPHLLFCRKLGFGLAAPILASIVVGALGAWVSPYVVITFLGIALCTTSVLTIHSCFPTITSWTSRALQQHHISSKRRQTRSWFSGTGLTAADAEALAGQGHMPRPGEKEDEFVHRMQHEGSSWITETGNGTRSRTALLSSFSYSASSMSGNSTPATPHTPGSTFPRAVSSSSVATTPHSKSSGSNQKSRVSSSLSNSWITEPTESGVTMSPWRFDTSNEVPPVPALTASTKAKYGIPESTSQSIPGQPVLTQAETTFYGEGPSIIHIGDPANMTFASYDSLPIKHGKRSTNFEILSPPAKTRPSKSPSVVSFRKKNKQRTMSEDSEESFHSARNDPCQSIESSGAPAAAAAAGRARRDPNQSFPQSVSTSLDDEMYCDAWGGSAADNVSINTDAVETVADEDELRGLGRYQHFPNDDLPPLPVPPARFSVNVQQVAGTSNRGASSSESEIFLPIHLGNSRQPGIHSDLPKGSRGTYSSYSSLASPMFGGYGGGADGEKKSTDPLLMRGKMSVTSEVMDWYGGAGATNPSRMVGSELRGQVNSLSADAEFEAHFKQLSWMAMGNLLVSWTSFAFAMPLLIDPGKADILATSLYLVAIAIPALSLVTSWITFKKLLLPLHLNEDKRASKLRPFMLQPQPAEVKLEQALELPATVDFSQWQTVLKNRLHSLRLKFRHDHGPSNEAGIIQISQARPSSRRFDKLTNSSIPQDQISVPHPVADIGKKEAEVVDDADETPRPYRFKRRPVDSAPLNNTSDIDDDRLSAYSILHGQGGRVSPIVGYPISPSRSEGALSRPDSMTSSPGAKSIKLASVQHAVRGRMSLGPSFLMGGSQGETIITAGRSVDLEAAIRAEIGGRGGGRERTYSTNQGENYEVSNFAPRVSEDQSRFQSTNRRSTDILGEFGVHEIKQERRRTFDFGRVWSGWKRSHEKGPADPEFAFEGVNPERMDAIMMSDFGTAKIAPQQPHVSRLSTSDYHDTFGGRHSVSTVRESNDLPAFRPSEDFILPGQQGDYPSIDFGRPSIAQDDRASFSVEGHGDASISTPRYPRQRNASCGPGSTLPEMTAMNFLAEFKGAIRELGTRAEDTPSREAVRSVLDGLATPHFASKKGSSTSIRSILKVRPGTEVRKIGPSTSIGHSLPPIPIDIAKSLVHKSSTYSIASTGRSTPVGLDEGCTSASHIHLSLPPPRNVRNVGKSSLGPLSDALHPVAEREEPVTVPHVAVRSEPEHSDGKSSPTPQQNSDFLAISEITPDNAHDRSASTNTAIEEIETIMAMDSPTTASYLKANLSRPHSVVTESYVGPLSAPANAHQHHLQASQSTQRTGPYPALKSSRSTPAFALASDWTSSRPTGDAFCERPSSANDRPSSTYSYLEKELGLPPLPIREAISSARRGSRAGSKTEVQRQVLEKVNGNATRPTQSSPAGKEDGSVAKARGGTACPEDVENIRVVDENGRSSPRKSIRKPKIRGSTRIGETDASVRMMRL